MKLYRDFQTVAEIDAQYNLGTDPVALGAAMQWYVDRSAEARAELQCELGVRYGPTVDEYLDVFPAAAPGSPVLVFVHGGYWVMASPREFSFVARGLAARGITTVIPNYSLCPAVTLDEITRQNRAALAWTHANAARYNSDPGRIYVSGHSAGGQQTGMLVATDWVRDYGLPADLVKAAMPVSGLFDLGPFPYSFLQPSLQLTWDCVARQSPIRHVPPAGGPPLLVTVGARETPEFLRQSRSYADAWRAEGYFAELLELPGADHFSVIQGFADADSPLLQHLGRLLRL